MGKGHIQGFFLWEKVIYRDFVLGKGHIQGFCCGKRSYRDYIMGKGHIQGFCYGKTSYTGMLLWDKVIYRDCVIGKIENLKSLFIRSSISRGRF